MFDYTKLLVTGSLECPQCSKSLFNGDILYKDEYRNEMLCAYCKDDYEEAVIQEEGENGELLK